jgi:hypothetical protein
VRDLLVDYLRERQPGVDYATLHKLSYTLGRLFWRDLEIHHPGIGSLRLPAEIATAWKQRINTKIRRVKDSDGHLTAETVPRINATEHLITVRAFYLDIAQWAAEEPARWGPWVVPCPIRGLEASRSKRFAHKSRMDQRTRERIPVMPVLIDTVTTAHKQPPNGYMPPRPPLPVSCSPPPGRTFAGQGRPMPPPASPGPRTRIPANDVISAWKNTRRSGPGRQWKFFATQASASRNSPNCRTTA